MKKKSNKNLNLKLKKNFTKYRYKGKKYIFITWKFYFDLLVNIENVKKKTRKSLFRGLAKRRLVMNYRTFILSLFKQDSSIEAVNQLVDLNSSQKIYDPLDKFFYRFNYPKMISLSYYKITENQLELIRRLARKLFGKRCFIKILIKASINILKRPNQMRMGGGKGSKFSRRVYFLTPGSSIFELRGVSYRNVKQFQDKLNKKVPFAYKIVLLNRI